MTAQIEHRYQETNGIRMHYATAGAGPAVLMLHGFPEHWYSWRYQLDALAEAGLSAIAPDLRGYGDTDKPAGGYDVESLVADVRGLVEGLGLEKLTLVGHDWGGPIAWQAAQEIPQVEKLAILNGPHPVIYLKQLRTSTQFFRSFYLYMFLVPGVAERLLSANEYAGIRASFKDAQRRAPQWISDEDIEVMTNAMKKPGALKSGLRYYRSNFGPSSFKRVRRFKPLDKPTLVIWGMKDKFVLAPPRSELDKWVSGPLTFEQLPGVGHWVGQEAPTEVNRLLIDFAKS